MSEPQPNPAEFSSFADWCLHKDSLSPEARHTVDVLLNKAGTSDINEANRILSNQSYLNLDSNQISDITPLQSLTNLTSLNLGYNQISDITSLQFLTNLTDLNLYNNQISEITPLQSLTNLTSLTLDNNQISDITPLQSLTNLTDLKLSDNPIAEITPLQSLTNLTELNLYNNQISEITPLQSLTNLTELNLYNNQISEITPLQSLTGLTSLTLEKNQISEITPLQSLTNLTDLKLSDNQISDITPLQSLTNLTFLTLDRNQISDITPLQSLTNLTSLKLSDNQISDITPLQSLTNLTFLRLSDNQISDITPLQSLTNLTYLYLNHNQILDITSLQSLTNLTYLYLNHNQILDITSLQSLTNLTFLILLKNQISDITPLQSLTNLTFLILYNNQISDITPLQSLTNLTFLILYNNQISDITPLQSLTNLTELNLYNNQISDITPLQFLTNLTNLILDFTPEQKALIEASRHSWEFLGNSTEPINRPQATVAVKDAYHVLDLETPEITFCSSPNEVFAQLQMLKDSLKQTKLSQRLEKHVKDALHPFSLTALPPELAELIIWQEQLEQQFKANFSDYHNYSRSIVNPKCLFHAVAVGELYISASGIALTPEAQKAFESMRQILAECDWIFAFENVCYVCSRPTKLCLDSEYRLHAEGEPALEFSDGYKLYSYHGVTLPEKYGQIHPNQWEASWILEEENAELRRVLIQGIGYARICSELQATDLDTWQEYTLLRIDADIDGFDPDEKEPIYLLKMTCPSTGFIHALRVPPDMQSAREAIRWVNWDVDYEEFSVQT